MTRIGDSRDDNSGSSLIFFKTNNVKIQDIKGK